MTKLQNKTLRQIAAAGTLAALLGSASKTQALEIEQSLRVKLGAIAEGARDLGRGGSATDSAEAFLEVDPAVRLQLAPEASVYGRVQAFVPTDTVVFDEDERPAASKEYVALRELWLEYGGLTSYPGEVLRLGLQRVRQPDGQWIDRDIESLRWLFDTTLIQAELGMAQQFATYRSDDIELSNSQRDRAYLFGDIRTQWRPGHYLGFRGVYADDREGLPAVGDTTDTDTKLADRSLTWLGVRADSDYFALARPQALAYWGEVSLLTGEQRTAEVAATDPTLPLLPDGPEAGTVTAVRSNNISTLGFDAGARLRLSRELPVVVGAGYALGEGAREDQSYQQTGLQSNRSRFTGTRALIHRYNEAYRAELSNLEVVTGFVSLNQERYDASLVFNRFRRDESDSSVIARGLDVQPVNDSRDLGQGIDLVASYYFGGLGQVSSFDDDLRSNVRLRGAIFEPGSAYGPDTDTQYRVLLETTLWF